MRVLGESATPRPQTKVLERAEIYSKSTPSTIQPLTGSTSYLPKSPNLEKYGKMQNVLSLTLSQQGRSGVLNPESRISERTLPTQRRSRYGAEGEVPKDD